MSGDDAVFSRSGHSHDGGKLSRRLDIPVSEELEEAVIALAAIAGVPKAEFARTLIERAVFRCLGNAVVPQIPEIIGRALMDLVQKQEPT